MRVASIDIGTNSIRLLIAEISSPRRYHSLIRRAKITRLGEGVNKDKMLNDAAMTRSEEVLQEYAREIGRHQIEKVIVAGTSALREAKNSYDFLERIENKWGWKAEILSGEIEARLSFLGATNGLTEGIEEVLVIDIGGGSTELILGQKNNIICHCSLDIGCVRLTEMFLKNDPPAVEDLKKMEEYIREEMEKAPQVLWRGTISYAMGLAGTVTTLSAIKQKMSVFDSSKIHGSFLTFEEVNQIFRKFISLSFEERKNIVGLEPKRADVIVAGAKILLELMKSVNLGRITVSEHDILDGLLLSKLNQIGTN